MIASAPVRRRLRRLTALCLLSLSGLAHAVEAPLWEAGIGLAGLDFPDYRGSDERHGYLLPYPYFVYRGDLIKVDRQGISGRLFRSERVVLDYSSDAAPPVESSKNAARLGMPDLDPTFELGPQLEICLSADCRREERLSFRLPVRAVLATDFRHIDGAGWVANPYFNYDNPGLLPGGWNFGLGTGLLYGSKKNHEYYYGVPAAYATPSRPAYEARAGYGGWRTLLTTSRRFDRYWVGAFARYDNLSGTAFEDSPLVRVRHSFMAGIGVAWILGHSRQRVEAAP